MNGHTIAREVGFLEDALFQLVRHFDGEHTRTERLRLHECRQNNRVCALEHFSRRARRVAP